MRDFYLISGMGGFIEYDAFTYSIVRHKSINSSVTNIIVDQKAQLAVRD